jgi:hypothetical protein
MTSFEPAEYVGGISDKGANDDMTGYLYRACSADREQRAEEMAREEGEKENAGQVTTEKGWYLYK